MDKRWIIAAGIAVLAAAGAGLSLLPDAEAEARKLAAELGEAAGQPASVAGPASIEWAWPPVLRVGRVELGELGALSDIVVRDGNIAADAVLLGRSGKLWGDATALRFSAGDFSAERGRSGAGWRASLPVAGSILALTGEGGRVDADWSDFRASGTLAWRDAALAFDVADAASLRLSGRYLPGEAAIEAHVAGAIAGLGDLTGDLRADAGVLDLGRFALSGGAVAAEGAFRREGGRDALDLRIAGTGLDGLAALAARVPPGDLDLRVRIGTLEWPGGAAEGVILAAARENGAVTIDELAVRALGGAALRVRDGMLDLQAPDATRFLRELGAPVERHLGALSLRGKLALDPGRGEARLAPLEVSLAGQRATGALSWRDGRLGAQLAGDRIDLGPFFAKPAPPPPVRGPLLTRSQTARVAAAAAPPPPGPGGWARVPLQLDLARGLPLDLELAARTLVLDAWELADARLAAAFDADGIKLDRLTGGFWGGRLEAAGRVTAVPVPRLAFEFALADAELARLAAIFGAPQALRGPATLTGRLAAAGRDAGELAGDLSGDVKFASPGGVLDGLDLAALAERLAAPGRAPDLLELGRIVARGGRTDFRGFAGQWTLAKGRAKTADTKLTVRGGAFDVAGEIDVANWRIDLSGAFAAAGPGAAAAPRPVVTLSGPADRPRVNLALKPAAPPAR